MDFLITPLWGTLADKYSKHRLLLLFTMIVSGIFYSATYFIPQVKQQGLEWTTLTNSTPVGDSNSLHMNSKNNFPISVDLNWCAPVIDDSNEELQTFTKSFVSNNDDEKISIHCFRPRNRNKEKYYCCKHLHNPPLMIKGVDDYNEVRSHYMASSTSVTFTLMIILIFAAKSLFCTTGPILDAVAMALAQEHNNDYGRQRAWGAISWGLFGAISGSAVDACTKYCKTEYIYAPAFAMFVGFVTLATLTAFKMKFHSHQSPGSISRNIWPLLSNPDMLIFLLILFLVGIVVGVISTYLFLFLQELNGPHSLMGLTLTISCLSEVPFMYYSSKILNYFGHKCIFYLCLLCYGIRLIGYSFLYNPWIVLPIELLHGVCYGAFWPTLTSYGNLLAPDGMEATVQTVAFAVNCGFGESLYYISVF